MKDRIIEIVELGQPQSLIQRENTHITELIKTNLLIEELNEQLRLYNVARQSEQLVCPNCDGEGFSGKGTNEILPCLSCFGSGERVD